MTPQHLIYAEDKSVFYSSNRADAKCSSHITGVCKICVRAQGGQLHWKNLHIVTNHQSQTLNRTKTLIIPTFSGSKAVFLSLVKTSQLFFLHLIPASNSSGGSPCRVLQPSDETINICWLHRQMQDNPASQIKHLLNPRDWSHLSVQ